MKNMDSITKIKKLTDAVEGFLSHTEGLLLYTKAKEAKKKGVIVEIGSFKGKSTVWISKGVLAGKKNKIYAVDPHISNLEHTDKKSSLPIFKSNLRKAGVTSLVTTIVAKSEDAVKKWDKPISFLWIDGDHTYKAAKKDFDLWSPFVIEGGTIAFHDSTYGDVQRVVKETIFKRGRGFKNAGIADSISYADKSKHTTAEDYARTQAVLLFNMSHSVVRKIVPLHSRNSVKKLLNKVGLPV